MIDSFPPFVGWRKSLKEQQFYSMIKTVKLFNLNVTNHCIHFPLLWHRNTTLLIRDVLKNQPQTSEIQKKKNNADLMISSH